MCSRSNVLDVPGLLHATSSQSAQALVAQDGNAGQPRRETGYAACRVPNTVGGSCAMPISLRAVPFECSGGPARSAAAATSGISTILFAVVPCGAL